MSSDQAQPKPGFESTRMERFRELHPHGLAPVVGSSGQYTPKMSAAAPSSSPIKQMIGSLLQKFSRPGR